MAKAIQNRSQYQCARGTHQDLMHRACYYKVEMTCLIDESALEIDTLQFPDKCKWPSCQIEEVQSLHNLHLVAGSWHSWSTYRYRRAYGQHNMLPEEVEIHNEYITPKTMSSTVNADLEVVERELQDNVPHVCVWIWGGGLDCVRNSHLYVGLGKEQPSICWIG